MKRTLNLARRPFVNEGPVLRLSGTLWLVALVLLGLNGWLYVRHLLGSRATREQQQTVRERIVDESARIEELREELSALDLTWQNTQAAFVNRRIDERVFSWSVLFDRLEEVLPGEVRLTSLAPDFRSRERQDNPDAPIELQLRGEARSSDGILTLVDRLFDHPSFLRPDLQQEVVREGVVGFVLEVRYELPERGAAAPEAAAEAPADGEGAEPDEAREPADGEGVEPDEAQEPAGGEGAEADEAAAPEDAG